MSNPNVESDSYDRGIIPAETAARVEREGEEYKHTPDDTDPATEGYTVDKEGLVNNYAIEPEMYYEEPGDLQEKEAAEAADREAELAEINDTDESGKLTSDHDDRGKGPGLV
ncbi:hypothetical protein H6F67_16510 [Microcoleus sp. FACHB-1515]|uniref:hypothetical protein n=1 Tax=Cyanophyceae TaxID=3028117 RepID=UPI00168885F5|nr:hypothetical protein [Microcoleus sp. FACHB-1515]MBD2091447.1 hypothetical protein [Microcoleus sp. FACHB-1515]